MSELCLCPTVLWEGELMSNEAGYSDGDISKQRVKGTACLWMLTVKWQRKEMN